MNSETTFGLETEGGPWPAFADLFAGVSLLFLVLFAAVTVPVLKRSYQDNQKRNTMDQIEAALAPDTVLGYRLLRAGNDIIIQIPGDGMFPPEEYEIETLKESRKRLIEDIVQRIKAKAIIPHISEISVVGHASGEGEDDENRMLSAKRAVTIATFLIKQSGLSACQVSALGRGRHYPVNPSPAQRANPQKAIPADRRIELRISPVIEGDSTQRLRRAECIA